MNTTTANIEIEVSNARIVTADVQVLDDGTCKLTIETEVEATTKMTAEAEKEVTKQENKMTDENDIFELVEASELSLNDEFMQYEPKTDEQKELKTLLTYAIQKGLKDFYCPRLDPSLDKYERICYKFGEMPAVKKEYSWWYEHALLFCPRRGSRLGYKTERVAFLGVMIKRLVASGRTVPNAWYAVCNDSRELGHYINSENAIVQDNEDDIEYWEFEETGSREICKFFDLGNTCKYVSDDKDDFFFWLAGGCSNYCSFGNPLASFNKLFHNDDWYVGRGYSVGWVVLEK